MRHESWKHPFRVLEDLKGTVWGGGESRNRGAREKEGRRKGERIIHFWIVIFSTSDTEGNEPCFAFLGLRFA